MKKGLFTGGRFDIPIKECNIRIYKTTKYIPKNQTIRLTK